MKSPWATLLWEMGGMFIWPLAIMMGIFSGAWLTGLYVVLVWYSAKYIARTAERKAQDKGLKR